jgi:hypothetical protein
LLIDLLEKAYDPTGQFRFGVLLIATTRSARLLPARASSMRQWEELLLRNS